MRYNSKPETTRVLLDYANAVSMIREIADNTPIFQSHHLEALRSGGSAMQDPNLPRIEIDSMPQLDERRPIVIGGSQMGMNLALQSAARMASIGTQDFSLVENITYKIGAVSMRHNTDWMLENRLIENRDQEWSLDGVPNKRRTLSKSEKQARKAKQKAARAARRKSR